MKHPALISIDVWNSRLHSERAQIFTEWLAKIVTVQRKFYCSLQESQLVARIIALSLEFESVNRAAAQHILEPVR